MDYEKIIKRSWELTWRNKWLWVYGLVITIMGGGAGFQGMRGLGNMGNQGDKGNNLPEELPEQATEILGQATNSILEWLKSVPIYVWVIGAIGLIGIIAIAIAIRWVTLSWAKAGLIYGLWEADDNADATQRTQNAEESTEKKVNLANTSSKGIKPIKRLILLGIIGFLITIGAIGGMGIIAGMGMIGFSFLQSPIKEILVVVWGLAMFLTFMVIVLLLGMVSIWAERLVVLEDYQAGKAWKTGFKLSWKHFWSVVVMGIINISLGCAGGCLSMIVMLLVLGIPAAMIAIPLFKNEWDGICWWSVGALGILFLLFIYLNILVKVILTVFNYGNWNLFYKEKMKKGGDGTR